MPPDTETLDKLYLEWSQFTGARTAREIEMLAALKLAADCLSVGDPEREHPQIPAALRAAKAAIAQAKSLRNE